MKTPQLVSAVLLSSLLSGITLYADHDNGYKDSPGKPLSLLVTGGYDIGGDKLLEIDYLDGSSDTVRVAQGFNIGVGGELRPDSSENFSLRGTVGFKFSSNRESDVDATIYTFPLEVSANWFPSSNMRLGIGYVEHISPKLDSDFGNTYFEDAAGPKYEIAYNGIALSYTNMNYQDQDGFIYSADTFGVSYSIAF